MDYLALFSTALLVGLTGAMMPGPLLTVTISETTQHGFKAAPLLILGHALLELILIIALAFGLSSIISHQLVTGLIGVLGGLVLIWMGWQTTLAASHLTLDLTAREGGRKSPAGPVLTGALVSLSNPYWSLWWATVGVSYVLLALQSGPVGLGLFYAGHILADIAWYLLIGALVVTGTKFISIRFYRWLLRFSGLFLIILGAYFSYSGVQFFL